MTVLSIRPGGGPAQPLINLLSSLSPLSDTDATMVRERLGEPRNHPSAAEIRFEEGHGERPLMVAAGWAAEVSLLEDGRRQIVSLHLPGDIIDPAEVRRMNLSAYALTSVRTQDANRVVAAATSDDPACAALAKAWRLHRHMVQARLVRHIIRLGRLTAYDRITDFLGELHDRQRRAGMADHRSLSLPMTQEALADHLGLSIVHVNRTLQQLRRDSLIDYQGGRVMVRDPAGFAASLGRTG